jgi:DNA gyrase subunit A
MLALENRHPKLFLLKEMPEAFIKHRKEVVIRRTIFDLRKAREKAHVLEGLALALANIDEIIELIKSADSPSVAKEQLVARGWDASAILAMLDSAGSDACRPDDLEERYGLIDGQYHLSPVQAQAILDLKLHKLTGLEHEKIINDYKGLIAVIAELLEILNSVVRLMEVIREELVEIKESFGDERRTEITNSSADLLIEDLIPEEDVVVTLSHEGYVKYQPLALYEAQRRGGKGKSATKMKEEDFIEKLLVVSTHATILCFSSAGKVYWLRTFELPLASRGARGKPIVNILPLAEGERITSILQVKEYKEDEYVFMATANGTVKKTSLEQFSRPRANGIIALRLDEGDSLIGTVVTNGDDELMLFSDAGKVIRFHEQNVRQMGRTARGVRGIRISEEHCVIALVRADDDSQILTVTENGYGKRTNMTEHPVRGRGGQGVISITLSERNGKAISAVRVNDGDEIMLISKGGTLVRTRVDEIRIMGRNTQGVRLIRLQEEETLVGLQRIDELETVEENDSEIVEGEVEQSIESTDAAKSDGETSTDGEEGQGE